MNNNENKSSYPKKYPKYYKTVIFAMTLTGMWTSATDRSINFINLTFFAGANVLGIVGTVVSLYETEEFNVYSVYESLIYMPLYFTALIGVAHVLNKRALLDEMFVMVEKGFESFNDNANTNAAVARGTADSCARFHLRCVPYVIASAHMIKVVSTDAWKPFSPTKIAFIPLSIYFYKSSSLLFYYIMYIVQFSVSASCAVLNVSCIVISVGLLNVLYSEVDALKHSFEDPDSLQISEMNFKKNFGIDDTNEELFYNRLKVQAEQHVNLIRATKKLELLISPLAFSMFAISEFIVCFCTFQIYELFNSGEKLDFLMVLNRVSLDCALMVQQFVYFVAGQRLESKSAELHRFLYYNSWYKHSSRCNSSMRIMFERTKVPLYIKAGYLIPINLSSFITCMQATFSYFNLLRALSL